MCPIMNHQSIGDNPANCLSFVSVGYPPDRKNNFAFPDGGFGKSDGCCCRGRRNGWLVMVSVSAPRCVDTSQRVVWATKEELEWISARESHELVRHNAQTGAVTNESWVITTMMFETDCWIPNSEPEGVSLRPFDTELAAFPGEWWQTRDRCCWRRHPSPPGFLAVHSLLLGGTQGLTKPLQLPTLVHIRAALFLSPGRVTVGCNRVRTCWAIVFTPAVLFLWRSSLQPGSARRDGIREQEQNGMNEPLLPAPHVSRLTQASSLVSLKPDGGKYACCLRSSWYRGARMTSVCLRQHLRNTNRKPKY